MRADPALAGVGIRIRGGTAADAAAIARVIVRGFASYTVRLDPPPSALTETAESISAKLDEYFALIAKVEQHLIGCVLAKPVADGIHVSRLAVDPAWHGCGCGGALMDALEATARGHGARALTLGVRIVLPDVQRFYLRRGFREVGREAHPGYSQPTFIRMEKVLA